MKGITIELPFDPYQYYYTSMMITPDRVKLLMKDQLITPTDAYDMYVATVHSMEIYEALKKYDSIC